ncbi:MAG TPA: hypothetical protein VNK51_02505 [Bradyrhizobium sp.]|nr:hypothetical protein [Bradyrhizobium sp.]
MELDAIYRGTVYPWQCDHVDRQLRTSARFAAAIREAASSHIAEPAEV